MSVNDMYLLIQYAINTSGGQGDLSPSEFNLLIAQGQNSFIDWLLGELQQYQPGRPISTVQYSENEIARQKLTPAIYGYVLTVDGNGHSAYPGDYIKTDAMWTLSGYKRIRYAAQNKITSFYNSRINPYPSNPFYSLMDDGFQFYPTDLAQAKLSYVRNPPAIIWGYDVDVNGLAVYNPTNSVQPIWADVDCLDIIVRALRISGVNLQMNQVIAYSEEIKNRGQ